MDKTVLVGPDLGEGRKFLDLLNSAKIPVNAAFWEWEESSGEWSLQLITPLVEEFGVRETYRRLIEVLAKAPQRPGIDLLNVSVFTPKTRFYKSLRRELKNARDIPISKRPIGDRFVESGFIYFVK